MTVFAPLILIFQKAVPLAFGLLGLTILIVLHELGHFLFCKLFHIDTPSFSVGFGPVLFSRKIGTTLFKICAIPLGGYVEMAGAAEVGQGQQADAYRSDNRSFASKPYYQKLMVMSGGILANLLFAYAALTAVCFLGYPPQPTPVIQRVMENSAAQRYGLQVNDTIVSANTKDTSNVRLLAYLLETMPGKEITLEILRNNERQIITVIPDEIVRDGKTVGALGVEFGFIEFTPQSWWETIKLGISLTHHKIMTTVTDFKNLIFNGGFGNLMGPIGIISLTAQGASQGIKILLLLLAIISINLAVLNLIPLPILDGGQILFYTIEAVIGRELSPRIREYIHIATWLLMLTLFIYLSTKDILRIFWPYIEKIFHLLH